MSSDSEDVFKQAVKGDWSTSPFAGAVYLSVTYPEKRGYTHR